MIPDQGNPPVSLSSGKKKGTGAADRGPPRQFLSSTLVQRRADQGWPSAYENFILCPMSWYAQHPVGTILFIAAIHAPAPRGQVEHNYSQNKQREFHVFPSLKKTILAFVYESFLSGDITCLKYKSMVLSSQGIDFNHNDRKNR